MNDYHEEYDTADYIPHNEAAERAVLGSLMLAPQRFDQADCRLSPKSFFRSENRFVWEAMSEIHGRGQEIDILLLKAELERSKTMEGVNIGLMLSGLMDEVPTGVHVEHYAGLVAEAHRLRGLLVVARNTIADVNERADSSLIAQRIMSDVDTVLSQNASDAIRLADVCERKTTSSSRIATGIGPLDNAMNGGMAMTDFLVIGARPKVGKSQVALQIVEGAKVVTGMDEQRPARAMLFTLEMGEWEIMCRMIARLGQCDLRAVMAIEQGRAGAQTLAQWGERYRIGKERASKHQLYLDAKPKNIHQVRETMIRMRDKVDFGIVDYMQILGETAPRQREYDRVTEASRLLKQLAQYLERPMVAVSQLSRGDGRPTISQLRSSGQIEQDANAIVLLHRDIDRHEDWSEMTVDLAAHRNGPTICEVMQFHAKTGRLVERPADDF